MQIRLDRVHDEPMTWDIEIPLAAEELGHEELLRLGPVRWQGKIEVPVGAALGEYLLTGRLSYEQTLACTRCLAPRSEKIDTPIQLMVVVRGAEPLPGDVELAEEDLGVLEIDSEVLDTAPVIRDQVELELPMRALCKPDCAGLCARCGKDLNTGSCDCPQHEIDPRWQALAEMRGN